MLLEQDLSPAEFSLFSEILWKLGSGKGQQSLRETLIADIATLLRADFAASYIWDAKQCLSKKGIMWQIDPKAMLEYDTIWQHNDPITALACTRRASNTAFIQISTKRRRDS